MPIIAKLDEFGRPAWILLMILGFTVWWPALANVGAFTSSPVGADRWAEHNLAWWIDTTKAPFVKS